MAVAGSAVPVEHRQPSPSSHLSINLPSNNPFRNAATSPSPRSATGPASKFPMPSTNPFLDNSELATSVPRTATRDNAAPVPDDIFKDLSLLDKPSANGAPPTRGLPPPRSGSGVTQGHRPGASDDRRDRTRGPPRPSDSPNKRDARPRRASESSVMERDRRPRDERDRSQRPERTESEERRRRERRREREERHRREKDKNRTGKPTRRPQGLDIIDKLDVTGVYGQGLFHHDGPFDACNPHRNAKKARNAPMQAFPEGSANMALGGSGPLRTRLDLDKFHGRGEEGFSEYAGTRKADTTLMDPTARVDQVHGVETYGLGTSTFLEGAPASRSAVQRRDSEEPNDMGAGGLLRKKSLVQRFRGMSNGRRPGDLRSPEARYGPASGDGELSPPMLKAFSAGGPGRARYTKENEINPFDNDYEAAFDKKGAQIRVAEEEKAFTTTGRPRAPSSPKGHGLVRTRTADVESSAVRSSSNEEERVGGGGFLNRMKSLKGGRRKE